MKLVDVLAVGLVRSLIVGGDGDFDERYSRK